MAGGRERPSSFLSELLTPPPLLLPKDQSLTLEKPLEQHNDIPPSCLQLSLPGDPEMSVRPPPYLSRESGSPERRQGLQASGVVCAWQTGACMAPTSVPLTSRQLSTSPPTSVRQPGWMSPEAGVSRLAGLVSGPEHPREVMQPLQELCRQHDKMGHHSPMSKDNKATERSALLKIKRSFAVQLSF